MGGGELEAGVADGGADAVTAFANGGVGKADRVEVVFLGLHAGEVHFDVDDAGIDAVDGGAEGFEEHGCGFCGECSSGETGFSVMAAVELRVGGTSVMDGFDGRRQEVTGVTCGGNQKGLFAGALWRSVLALGALRR